MHRHVKIFAFCLLALVASATAGQDREEPVRIDPNGKQTELRSRSFVLRLDASAGLRATSWENRLTGQTVSLGNGPELEFDIGLPGQPLQTPALELASAETKRDAGSGEAVFTLQARQPALRAVVTYRWDAKQPVLRKFVTITNEGDKQWDRLLNVRLGTYQIDAKSGTRRVPATSTADQGQGFPLYLGGDRFLSLAHPAGWATGKDGVVSLRQYPGVKLAPGKTFTCMETVYGVAEPGKAHEAFAAHLQSRMRRVLRHHDKPYAILESFGGKPDGSFEESEQYVLDHLAKVAQGQRESGCHFDFYSMEFWVDYNGDLKRFDPQRFPSGFRNIRAKLAELGMAPGLWIDSSWAAWSVGGNPAVQNTINWGPGKDMTETPHNRRSLCRATEPIKSMYADAFRYHIRENGARLLKFDNFATLCMNPSHEHLPGIYSTEPIMNGAIDCLHALDKECPDVLLMLYWGYGSPWWLLHGDTLSETGIDSEAANPGDFPAPSRRTAAIHQVDQAEWHAARVRDIPALGRDSLGVWLSDWPWNGQIGKERWQDGMVMDLCRGNLLAQVWTDTPWLSPPERKQLAEFIALLKARPECFRNSRFILGNPWTSGPYGYCCTDGERAFLALNNACWQDSVLRLELGPAWGLPADKQWDVYRWHPDPAKLQSESGAFGEKASIALRPFEIVLLEVVAHGQSPSLGRQFPSKPIPLEFAQSTRPVEISLSRRGILPRLAPSSDVGMKRQDAASTVKDASPQSDWESPLPWTALEPLDFRSAGGATLSRQPDNSILAGGKNPSPDTYTIEASSNLTGITAIRLEVMTDPSLPGTGPGRASDGNFILNEFSVRAWPKDTPAAAAPVALHDPLADHSEGYPGIRPVGAAIDGNPKTGWSIRPEQGLPHAVIFPTRKPLGGPGGTTLEITIQQGSVPGHNLGRLRLSVTAAKPPFAAPKPTTSNYLIEGHSPASPQGGTIILCAELSAGGRPVHIAAPGKSLAATAELAGQTVACQPVLPGSTSWQAWRIDVDAAAKPRPLAVHVAASIPASVELKCYAHFIPK